MEEELVIDKKPYPGLQVFNTSNCLRYFSKETMLAKHLGSITTEHYLDHLVFSALHHLVSEPEKLFYLMSVCPEEEIVDVCRDCWQHNETFTVSAEDVILVFLNWGATPESLGIHGDEQLSSRFTATLAPTSLPNFPAPHNVKAVLDAISDCPSDEEGDDADRRRCTLIKVLVTASLDERLRQHRFKFHQAISNVLETFPVWTLDKAAELVEHLCLLRMGLQNAAYVCCSWFTSSPRAQDFKVAAVRHLLHSRFGMLPPLEPFQSLLQNLPPTEHIVERFRMLEIYVLIQLLNTLLMTCSYRPKNDPDASANVAELSSDASANVAELSSSMTMIEILRDWADAVHSELMAPKLVYTIEGGFIREKCVRLRADCVEVICILKNDAKSFFQMM